MNVQQLKVFVEVMKRGTLQGGAEHLGLKQPTVSFHLRKLEEELGVELFRKHSRNLRPTKAAEELLPYARHILSLMDEAAERMSMHAAQTGIKLKLGASYTPATYYLPPYLAEFRHRYPSVQLLLNVKKAESMLHLLRNYEIDVAIVSLPQDEEKGLCVIPLLEDELQLVMSPQHPLANMEHLTADDLQEETFLLHESGTTSRRLAEEWASTIGLEFRSTMELGAIETIKESLKYSMGIGVLPLRSVLRETTAGELVKRSLPGGGYSNRRYICLVYRDEPIYSQHTKMFIDYMQAAAEVNLNP
ncbi:LysR family transcriptional regulator [Paenibacillus terreus]|uniref:LysR family transcriptional regulator n=1 Tax=Paenibacillus terreus TaxID=1387834 RepID=A0ABV5BAK2_9BACL